jgi:hypothetical protein
VATLLYDGGHLLEGDASHTDVGGLGERGEGL